MSNLIVTVWVCNSNGQLQPRPLHPKIPADAQVCDLEEEVALLAAVSGGCLSLWKPNKVLGKDIKARSDIYDRLEKSGHEFQRFCTLLEPEDRVADILSLSSQSIRKTSRTAKQTALVVQIHADTGSVPITTPRDEEEGDILAELNNQYRALLDDKTHASPSVSAQPLHYSEYQSGRTPILDGRYGVGGPQPRALPIEIFHPAFAAFVAEAQDQTLSPPDDFVLLTSTFIKSASRIAGSESERGGDLRTRFAKLLSTSLDETVSRNRSSADHIGTCATGYIISAPFVIIEEKAELGQSGEPSVQGSFSYIESWSDKNRRRLADGCFCPSFLISIAGPWICVCGAVLTSHAIVQRLSDFVWISSSRAVDDEHTFRLARFFFALKRAVGKLQDYYQKLTIASTRTARFFPIATAFTLADDRRVAFHYLRPFKSGTPECAAFLAADDGDETCQYVVKFVERYGEEAHRCLADAGYAPQLLYYGAIWSEGAEQRGCGRHRMVVIDYIEGVSAADYDLDDEEGLGGIRAGVRRALEVLHAAGMVHGDIRWPNILIEAGEGSVAERVKIIDFDWAGVEGEVKYPLDLARNGWVDGVEELAKIEASHDRGMVDRLRA